MPLDVRIVSASNRDLAQMAADGDFLPDLLYRLQVVTVAIPPLRDRPQDIRPLVDRFVAFAGAEHGRRITAVEPGYYEALERYDWPGNVRQLRNAVESSVVMAAGESLGKADVRLGSQLMDLPACPDAGRPKATLAEIERTAILGSLQRNDGNRTLCAEELGVSVRTIQRKIKEYRLPF